MHPYNAVHVVHIPGTHDLERLRLAINGTLEARSLTGLTLVHEQGTYAYAGGPACCEIVVLKEVESLSACLSMEIERQLNTPFLQSGPFTPFRFFVAQCEGSFALGLAYLHAVADAQSIVLLLREIVAEYGGRNERNDRPANHAGAPPRGNPLLFRPGVFVRKLTSLPALVRNMRSSCRPPYRNPSDLNNGFKIFRLQKEDLRRLVETAKAWGITVNDLLLALLMKSCALQAPGRERGRGRKKISVGCIVNTRREFSDEHQGAFGLFLGSFVITHAVPAQVTLKELAADIGRATLDIKRKKLYLATAMELSFGRLVLSFFSEERRKRVYQKNYPLWGGLTNMNINSLWPSEKPTDYFRGVSTGPVTPLVLSFTTAGESANIGLSYRSTVFTAADIERLGRYFLDAVTDPEVAK